MWVYKDDHTDVRILGAVAKALPELVNFASVEKFIHDKLKDSRKTLSARLAHECFATVAVEPGQGSREELIHLALPRWESMAEGVSIKGQPQGGPYANPVTHQVGGFRPARNPLFKKYTTRTMRPVVNFATCTQCTLCWLNCPDASFDVTPDATYDANLEACCGCGICEAVCPVKNCITMVNENAFHDNDSQWVRFKKNPDAYLKELAKTIESVEPVEARSHGFRFRGQYQQQVPAAMEVAQRG